MVRTNIGPLRQLYRSLPAAKTLFEALVDAEPTERTTVDELIDLGLGRRNAVELLRQLEELGCGEFRVGRKGHPSRLEWTHDTRDLARRLSDHPREDASEEPPDAEDEELDADALEAEAEPTHELEAEQPEAEEVDFEDDDEPEPPRRNLAQLVQARAAELAQQQLGLGGLELPEPEPPPPPVQPRRPNQQGIAHIYVLRRDFQVVVQLPEDLSRREAEVLADWLRNLSFDR